LGDCLPDSKRMNDLTEREIIIRYVPMRHCIFFIFQRGVKEALRLGLVL